MRPEQNRPMTAEEFTASVAAVTSAFGDPTRRDIYLFVRESSGLPAGGVTATEVAERFELHPNVARHHLEKLTGGGYLTVAPAHPADVIGGDTARSAGRPSKLYRTGDVDATLSLPPRHDDLLAQLLARALDLLGPDQASAMRGRWAPRSRSQDAPSARCARRWAPSPRRSQRTASPRTPSRAVARSRSCRSAARSEKRPRSTPTSCAQSIVG
jgi:DNA-binding transcriptional ArsR family regulator